MSARVPAFCAGVVAFVVSAAGASAQELSVEQDQQYLVLEVSRLDTFEKEVNAAAGLSFRLLMAATSEEGSRVQALMERATTVSNTFRYQLVATFSQKTGDKEMNEAAMQGYRLVPHTAMLKRGITLFNLNHVMIMEKTPMSAERFEYRSSPLET